MTKRTQADYQGYGTWTFDCPNCGYTSKLDRKECTQCGEPIDVEVILIDA